MKLVHLRYIDQIKHGDILLLNDGREVIPAKVEEVKVSDHDGTEIIFNKKDNKYFNVGMYLDEKSWVKEAYIVHAY